MKWGRSDMKKDNITGHALKRLRERTSLDVSELNQLLGSLAYVPLGSKPGIHKEHLLFFSERDNACFVALRDTLNGDVVTILPVNYHENLAWKVTREQCEAAKILAHKSMEFFRDYKEPKAIHVALAYLDQTNTQKYKSVMKITDFYGSFSGLVNDPNFAREIHDKSEELGIAPSISGVSIRRGKKGVPTFYEMSELG